MLSVGKWRWPLVLILPCVAIGLLFQFGLSRWVFQSPILLTSTVEIKTPKAKAPVPVRLNGEGPTPSRAVEAARTSATAYMNDSVTKQKAALHQTLIDLEKKKVALTVQAAALTQERQRASRGAAGSRWTSAKEQRLQDITYRRNWLLSEFPNHTDIPGLANEINSLTAQKRGGVTVDRKRLDELAQKINETQIRSEMIVLKAKDLSDGEKLLKTAFIVSRAAIKPRWPVRVDGWQGALGAGFGMGILAFFLFKGRKEPEDHVEAPLGGLFRGGNIPLKVVTETELEPVDANAGKLPDDPLFRKAAGLYEQWLALVQVVYTPSSEPPQGLWTRVDPLLKDTASFMPDGHDAMTRYLAQVVIPGDLPSHVTRTVLMSLIGAHEAGASSEQHQGMALAALFHDVAVAPRPENAWHEIGSEVGRLSSNLIKKVPGIPAALITRIEDILVAMDEYPMEMWQNVARNKDADPFAKLLRQIDRFDKVLQKQKTRLNRRLTQRLAS